MKAVAQIAFTVMLFCAENLIAFTYKDISYHSDAFNQQRNFRIFLPPDYASSGKTYPVVYFMHGWAGNYTGPKTPLTATDWLIEARYYDDGTTAESYQPINPDNFDDYVRTHDLIVVKLDGHYVSNFPGPWSLGNDSDTWFDYGADLMQVVEKVDTDYPTLSDRDQRAICGLSMGGFFSMYCAARFPDVFSAWGGWAR